MINNLQVGAVIVTYRAPVYLLERLMPRVAGEVSQICVVVNQADAVGYKSVQAAFPAVRWILNETNQGLAAAQNQGIESVLPQSDAVLLLDQDSLPRAGDINALKQVLQERLQAGDRIAAVGPAYTDIASAHWPGFVRQRGWRFVRVRPNLGDDWIAVDFLIASGMLMPVPALRDVGLMDADLFIDHVDTEWCLRAAHQGYRLLGTENACFTHELGAKRHRVWFGRMRQVSTHSPWRYYMSFRNSALLHARPYLPAPWRRANTMRLVLLAGLVALVGPNRCQALRSMWRGWRDGRAGKFGPPPKTAELA